MKLKQLLGETLAHLVIFLVSFHLIFYPMQDAWAGECEGYEEQMKNCAPNQEWNSELCRCQTTEQALNVRNRYKDCAKIKDQTERKACFERIANEEAGDMEPKDKGTADAIASSIFALSFTFAVVCLVAAEITEKVKSCKSHWALAVAGVAGIAIEVWTYMEAQKKIKKLQKQYQQSATQDDPYSAQIDAFKYLKKEQKTVEKLAKAKSQKYMVMTGLFSIAALIAVYELTFGYPEETCPKGGFGYNNNNQKEMEKIFNQELDIAINEIMGENNPISSMPGNTNLEDKVLTFKAAIEHALNFIIDESHAKIDLKGKHKEKQKRSMWAMLIGVGGAAVVSGVGIWGSMANNWTKWLTSSIAVLIFSGFGIGLTASVIANAKKEAKKAKKNAKKIQEIIDRFQSDIATFCPKGRDNLEEPKCYCYLEGGGKNPARSNSDTCKTLWAKNDRSFAVKATDYESGPPQQPTGCMTMDKKFDQDCKCKKYTNVKTGDNACFKVSSAKMNIGTLGTKLGTNSISNRASQISNGNYEGATANIGQLQKRAARIQEVTKKLAKKIKLKKFPKDMPKDPFDKNFHKKMLRKIATPKRLALAKSGIIGQGYPTQSLDDEKGEVLKEAMKKAGLKGLTYNQKKERKVSKKKKNDSFNFNFNEESETAPKIQSFDEDYMNKTYKFKEDDIVKNDGIPIWRIITKRYNQSAYRRLFENGQEI